VKGSDFVYGGEEKYTLNTIAKLVEYVQEAGNYVFQAQSRRPVDKHYKPDGSVITAFDHEVEKYLIDKITGLYPDVNIMGEETSRAQVAGRKYTFLLDPIDGTDAFSQGMPAWCVSVGVLDAAYQPTAGIIFAPALELLLFADIGLPATANGQAIEVDGNLNLLDSSTNLMIPSSAHQYLDLRQFKGKARSIGSAALHLCYPLLYPRVFAAIESKSVHAWDIAGAHAINRSVGFDIEMIDGRKIDYQSIIQGKPVGNFLLSGTPERIAALKRLIRIL
jgi:fructose-1,6-bisphosphatase/inositol monophosphatase family enzyme